MMRKLILGTAILALILTGCEGDRAETRDVPQHSAPHSDTAPEAQEIDDDATPEQLASVIAKNETVWRDAIANRQSCQSAQGYAALPDATPAEKSEAEECLLMLTMAGDRAGTAAAELESLNPPGSMDTLVDDTVKYLKQISDADLTLICDGEPFGPACTSEDTAYRLAYLRLEQQLDAWIPYL